MIRRRVLVLVLMLAVFIAIWLYVGIAKDAFFEESYDVLFIKKQPTLKLVFVNSYLTDSDIPSISEWPIDKLDELKSYCKYRFGIADQSAQSLDRCANLPFRTHNIFLDWYVGR